MVVPLNARSCGVSGRHCRGAAVVSIADSFAAEEIGPAAWDIGARPAFITRRPVVPWAPSACAVRQGRRGRRGATGRGDVAWDPFATPDSSASNPGLSEYLRPGVGTSQPIREAIPGRDEGQNSSPTTVPPLSSSNLQSLSLSPIPPRQRRSFDEMALDAISGSRDAARPTPSTSSSPPKPPATPRAPLGPHTPISAAGAAHFHQDLHLGDIACWRPTWAG